MEFKELPASFFQLPSLFFIFEHLIKIEDGWNYYGQSE